ncbi:proline racemase family protein [Nonomuraea sp. NPDC001831]|uniref:proline racemase family protein n=1 Tax=Nonomuraea sp. NPDC001831 TaxID=3364340 RepID=UPI0036C12694
MIPPAFGDTEGQPVACYDATAVPHSGSRMREVPALMADTLEEIQRDYFEARAGDPGAIVAVLVAPVRSEADLGLVFMAADGPLDGCGEASMFAAMLVLGSRPEVRLETGAGLIIARSSGEARITLTMPPGTSRVDVAEVSYEGKRLQVRTVTAGGNVFAAVSAAELELEVSAAGARALTEHGSALLGTLRAGPARPHMLLLTTPVTSARTTSAVVWGDAVLHMGPCGTGTCARCSLAVEDGDVVPGSRLAASTSSGVVYSSFQRASQCSPGGRGAVPIRTRGAAPRRGTGPGLGLPPP